MRPNPFFCTWISTSFLALNLLACGDSGSQQEPSPSIVSPSASQALQSKLQLRFTTFTPSKTSTSADSTLVISDGLVLTDARLNISRVKLDRARDPVALAKKREIKQKKETLKNKIRGWELEIDAIEETYKPRLKLALNKAEKEALKAARDQEIEKIEAKITNETRTVKQEIDLLKLQIEDNDLQWTGNFVYDLIQGRTKPDFLPIDLFEGSYEHIDFAITPNPLLPANDPLARRSLYIAGRVTLDKVSTAFELVSDQTEYLRLDLDDSFQISSNSSQSLLLGTVPQLWFKDWNIQTAQVDKDGVIRIDATHNVRLFRQFMDIFTSLSLSGIDDHGRHHGLDHEGLEGEHEKGDDHGAGHS